jgi:hypothetical protein
MHSDPCFQDIHTKQSRENANYFMRNFYSCNLNSIEDLAYSQQRVIYKNGYGSIGKNGDQVDKSSKMRHSNLTNFKNINQLDGLPYTTSPNLSKGKGDICVESFLKSSEDTFQQRPCNNLAGMNINRFVPMIDCLKKNIQDPKHIIPEMVDDNWIRGGAHSRQIVRQKKYLEKCGYQYNGKYWIKSNSS